MTFPTPSILLWKNLTHLAVFHHVASELFVVGVEFGGQKLDQPHLLRQEVVFLLLDRQVRNITPYRGSMAREIWDVSERGVQLGDQCGLSACYIMTIM